MNHIEPRQRATKREFHPAAIPPFADGSLVGISCTYKILIWPAGNNRTFKRLSIR